MTTGFNRREILQAGLAGFAGIVPLSLFAADAHASTFQVNSSPTDICKISFHNQHTGESFNGAYRVGHKYIPDAFEQINTVLRDFRTHEIFPIDPRAIDILYMINRKSSARNSFEVLSGYRSPKTNEMLRRVGHGVAKNSLHLTGQAIDIRVPGYSTRRLHDVAIDLHAGGVGYYPVSNFVHIDTGKVRSWQWSQPS